MPVFNNATIKKFDLPGLEHQTLAERGMGVNAMEVWMQTIAPGTGTPVHRHACEEVIVILRGSGQVNGASRSLEDVERDHILAVLEQTGWVVEGAKGAARVLNLNPNTLRSRMKKLGIHRTNRRPAHS